MNQKSAEFILSKNKSNLFPNNIHSYQGMYKGLLTVPDEFTPQVSSMPYRDPLTTMLISILVGPLGVDRFYLEDYKLGILKLITMGGFGIWWLVDIFSAKKRCRTYNCKRLVEAIQHPTNATRATDSLSGTIKSAKPLVGTILEGAKNIRDTFDAR